MWVCLVGNYIGLEDDRGRYIGAEDDRGRYIGLEDNRGRYIGAEDDRGRYIGLEDDRGRYIGPEDDVIYDIGHRSLAHSYPKLSPSPPHIIPHLPRMFLIDPLNKKKMGLSNIIINQQWDSAILTVAFFKKIRRRHGTSPSIEDILLCTRDPAVYAEVIWQRSAQTVVQWSA